MPSGTAAESATARLVAWRWPLLAVAVALTLAAWRPATQLDFDRSIENMFAADDPLLPPYFRLKRTFGSSELVSAVYLDPELLTVAGMRRLAALEAELAAVPGVAAVLSLRTPMGDRIIETDNSLADRFRMLFDGYTYGSDREAASVVCMLEPLTADAPSRTATVAALRAAVAVLPSGTLAGEPVMIVDGFRYIEDDGKRLGWNCTLLLVATIFVCFRSLRWVLIPLLVVQASLIWTRALLVVSGFRLSMVSSMLTAIVTVVGVATVVHIVVRFRDARRDGCSPEQALVRTGGLVAGPIVWACATDAVGFGALLTAGVGPVQDFGAMMATGSLLVIPSVALLVPALALAGGSAGGPRTTWGDERLGQALAGLLHQVERRPRAVGLTALAAAAVIAVGVLRLEVETDFTRNFRRGSPVVRAYEMVEDRMGGAGVWDLLLPAPDELDWRYLSELLILERRLREEVPELTKVLSVADAVVASAPVDLDKIRLASLRQPLINTSLEMMQTRMPRFMEALVGRDPQGGGRFVRVMLRARERQPAQSKREMIDAVRRISEEQFGRIRRRLNEGPGADGRAEVTGFFVLLASLIESMVRDQWTTFLVATLGIGLMMGAAFRRPGLAAVALVPNALPIVMVTGLMGWLGLKVNMGAVMIAAVSMGLSVDASIHYISAFLRARRAGLAPAAALAEVQQTVGRALVFATLALVVGFGALAASQFVPTVYFGVLVSLSMLGGLAGNLVVLPLLLAWITRGETGTASDRSGRPDR